MVNNIFNGQEIEYAMRAHRLQSEIRDALAKLYLIQASRAIREEDLNGLGLSPTEIGAAAWTLANLRAGRDLKD